MLGSYAVAKGQTNATKLGVLQGTLDLMVLQTLDSMGPQHGYGITAAIKAGSSHALQVDTGSLYPALHRLEREGSVAAGNRTGSYPSEDALTADRSRIRQSLFADG